jgi:flagellar protein FlbD
MIRLTRINKSSLAINADLIKFVETAPDTVITLSTGEKVVVTESLEQIIDLIVQFRRLILTGIPCPALASHAEANSVAHRAGYKVEDRTEIGRTL